MGYEVEVHEGEGAHLYGYMGKRRQQKANIIVRRKHIGSASNDYGWRWDPQKKRYIEIISEYDVGARRLKEGALKQNYAERKLTKEARRRGFSVNKRLKDGKILMTLRRAY